MEDGGGGNASIQEGVHKVDGVTVRNWKNAMPAAAAAVTDSSFSLSLFLFFLFLKHIHTS